MEKDLDKILYNTCAIIFLFSFMSLLKQLGAYIVCYIYITYIYIYIYISYGFIFFGASWGLI